MLTAEKIKQAALDAAQTPVESVPCLGLTGRRMR